MRFLDRRLYHALGSRCLGDGVRENLGMGERTVREWARVWKGLPWRPGAFRRRYRANRDEANETVLESSPVAVALQRVVEAEPEGRWIGTAAELLKAVQDCVDDRTLNSPRGMTAEIKRLAPNLRGAGWTVELPQGPRRGQGNRREILLVAPVASGEGSAAESKVSAVA